MLLLRAKAGAASRLLAAAAVCTLGVAGAHGQPRAQAEPSQAGVRVETVTIGPPVRIAEVQVGDPVKLGRTGPATAPADTGACSPRDSPFFIGKPVPVGPFGGPPAPPPPPVPARSAGGRRTDGPAVVFMPWYPIGSHFTAGLPAWRHGTERTSQQPAGTDAVREEPAGPAAPAVAGSRPEAGGITLELSPGAAGVYLDGSFVGHASDFLPSRGVLRLPPGVHTIELRADGYAPERFEIMATSGQLIPLAGSLQALSPGSVTAPGR